MSAMPVPPQITSLGEMSPIKPAPPQWYEEKPATEVRNVEGADRNLNPPAEPTETVSPETTSTLIPDEKLARVVNTTNGVGEQTVTTINGEDAITSLADTTENKAIQEINSAHGTK